MLPLALERSTIFTTPCDKSYSGHFSRGSASGALTDRTAFIFRLLRFLNVVQSSKSEKNYLQLFLNIYQFLLYSSVFCCLLENNSHLSAFKLFLSLWPIIFKLSLKPRLAF